MNSNRVVRRNKSSGDSNLDTLLQKGENQQQRRQAKRDAQHAHWMRVMSEGQSTPDLSYQKSDT